MAGSRNKKFTVIDLFCGCGGLSYGFIQSGYDVTLGVDHDDAALKTFEANHPDSVTLNTDLSKPGIVRDIKKRTGKGKVDVIIAGPPCQGFSLTGPRNFDDDRNKLYLTVIKMVGSLKPKAFLVENVPGLVGLYKGMIKDEIIKRFEQKGYNVSVETLCAADYGVPQLRKRVFFVGLKKNLGRFVFPRPTHTENNYVTCGEAISDLPSRKGDLGREEDKYIMLPKSPYQKRIRRNCRKLYNHVATDHKNFVKEVISLVPEGKNYKALPPGVGISRRFNEAWTRYHSRKPSRTIDTGHRNHFHYKYNRVPTIRENARLQSFHDSFIFYGTRTQQNKHVGNAVPPLLGYHIAKKLLKYI
jgi:DNA (cytosine-5)-methyltransferase 1